MNTRAARAARGVPSDEGEVGAGATGVAVPALIALGMGTLTMTVL
jgi:hypothetical protein